ncbi:MAG: prepilin-type N-terminal cleavage/methylation domain-containing protein [Myxococcota bacterium]
MASGPSQARRGFSLVEALVATGILGIGLAALTNAHLTSIRGIDGSAEAVEARALANQLAEELAMVQTNAPNVIVNSPACVNTELDVASVLGCAAPAGNGFSAVQLGCTRYYDAEAVQGASPNVIGGSMFSTGDLVDGGQRFRADIFIQDHPDPAVDPTEAQVAIISVCWRDPLSPARVKQVRLTRVLNRLL